MPAERAFAALVLEDGRAFVGAALGADVVGEGEVVFNTAMTGYQEILTDPSYAGQMVCMTYPLQGNYGVREADAESSRPWARAFVVRWACPEPSHHSSEASLDEYLRRWNVPGISDIDTRALTRHLRTHGAMRAVLVHELEAPSPGRLAELAAAARRVAPLSEQDLVAETSRARQEEWHDALPPELRPRGCSDGSGLTVAVVDYGVKTNILRSLRERGCTVVVLPHTATWSDVEATSADGLVLSNGPGDPAVLEGPVALARQALDRIPMFGICLGHQVIGRAAGATTSRLPFGHHGANHPVKDLETGRVHITSQNHEFQVDASSIPSGDFFVSQRNLNDGSVEGLGHRTLPVFSVQYHPEGCPGPQDNQHLYDRFVEMVRSGVPMIKAVSGMSEAPRPRKVLILGSGPIVIGQAAEFDYAGTQACKALREEGIETVLVNSNPATIMTDEEVADRVYLEPLTVEAVERVIEREKPDALLPTLGGQTGLNLATDLAKAGVLERHGVRLLGAGIETIKKAEDRQAFKEMLREIGEPVPDSRVCESIDQVREFANEVGLPLVIRPAYTLGGTGGGFVTTSSDLERIANRGLDASPIHQVLVERSLWGWKELEYEVMRDAADTCITVCNMENLDPMGVHTGDSIVVAPAQTLSDRDHQMLRSSAIRIIRALGIEGGCNVQFALDPKSSSYHVIEVNPRVSRSSALASKATGYPIARVAAKVAIGRRLEEIRNEVTGRTFAAFEPALDYCVVKIPRWPFDKFPAGDRRLGTQMASTGEVMAIERTFEAALTKAMRSLEQKPPSALELGGETIDQPNDRRLFALMNALREGATPESLAERSGIDRWFLDRIAEITEARNALQARAGHEGGSALLAALTRGELRRLKRLGFADAQLGYLLGTEEEAVRERRAALGVHPTYKTVDTCGAEFAAATPYYYSTFEDESEVAPSTKETVIILGSGPNRIGQGIEFDYCCVHASMALREAGYETVMVNCNPETVSTDYDTSDRLYFEPITEEDVRGVIAAERAAGGSLAGVIVGLGGQTPLKLAAALSDLVLGTAAGAIDLAEDRERWNVLCAQLEIPQPAGGTARSLDEALAVTERIGYPALVRPSYVLGGRAMEIVYDGDDLAQAMASIAGFAEGQTAGSLGREGGLAATRPVLVDRFLEDATEVDVDAVRDRTGKVLIGGIMEHVEEAGVHSGDSACAIPPPTLSVETTAVLEQYTARIAEALSVVGPINVQYAVQQGQVFVIEANPRASRTVPFVAKATGVPLAKIAARTMLGATLAELRAEGLLPPPAAPRRVAVKEAVLPFSRFPEVDALLGPEMRSTGEVMGLAATFGLAFAKSQIAAGNRLPEEGGIFFSLADRDKPQGLVAARAFAELGFTIAATEGTASYLEANGVAVETRVAKLSEVRAPGAPSEDGLVDATALIASGRLQLVVNTPRGRGPRADGAYIRHAAGAADIPILTTAAAARAAAAGIADWRRHGLSVLSLQEHHAELRPAVGEQVGQG